MINVRSKQQKTVHHDRLSPVRESELSTHDESVSSMPPDPNVRPPPTKGLRTPYQNGTQMTAVLRQIFNQILNRILNWILRVPMNQPNPVNSLAEFAHRDNYQGRFPGLLRWLSRTFSCFL